MDLCHCEAAEWQGLQDGIWTAVNSPYGNKYVDVKLADKKPARFTLPIQEGQDCSRNQFLFSFSVIDSPSQNYFVLILLYLY